MKKHIALLIASLYTRVIVADPCILCAHSTDDSGIGGLTHPLEFVDSKGKTCSQLMLELFKLDKGDQECLHWRNSSHQRCCHQVLLPPIQQDPPPPPPQFTLTGPYSKCDLCIDGSYPSATSMVINMLYVGIGTCPQYYEMGQRGWIHDHLCQPLQYYANEPCGCKRMKPSKRSLSDYQTLSPSRSGVMDSKGKMKKGDGRPTKRPS